MLGRGVTLVGSPDRYWYEISSGWTGFSAGHIHRWASKDKKAKYPQIRSRATIDPVLDCLASAKDLRRPDSSPRERNIADGAARQLAPHGLKSGSVRSSDGSALMLTHAPLRLSAAQKMRRSYSSVPEVAICTREFLLIALFTVRASSVTKLMPSSCDASAQRYAADANKVNPASQPSHHDSCLCPRTVVSGQPTYRTVVAERRQTSTRIEGSLQKVRYSLGNHPGISGLVREPENRTGTPRF